MSKFQDSLKITILQSCLPFPPSFNLSKKTIRGKFDSVVNKNCVTVLSCKFKHNTHEAFREKLNFNFDTFRLNVFVSARKVKKFCITRQQKVSSVQLKKKPHGNLCATLLALSDIHRVIDCSWHCLIVVGFAFLACCRRHVVALLDCRSFAFWYASFHRRFIDRIGKLLWVLTRVLSWKRRVMRCCWCTPIA